MALEGTRQNRKRINYKDTGTLNSLYFRCEGHVLSVFCFSEGEYSPGPFF